MGKEPLDMLRRLHALRTSVFTIIVGYVLISFLALAIDMVWNTNEYFSNAYWLDLLDRHLIPDIKAIVRLLIIWGLLFLIWRSRGTVSESDPGNENKRKHYVTKLGDLRIDWEKLGIEIPKDQKSKKPLFDISPGDGKFPAN